MNTVVKKCLNLGIQAVITAIIAYILSMWMLILGDRMEDCHGLLVPIGVEISSKKGYVIVYKCEKCGQIRKNISARDDNMSAIIKLSANPL